MRVRYERKELQALRYANVEPPEGADLVEMQSAAATDQADPPAVTASSSKSSSSRKRRKSNKSRNPRPSKQPRIEDEDEDGDFGGMFDEGEIFQNVFVDAAAEAGPAAEISPETTAAGGYCDNFDESESEDDDGPLQRVAFVVEGEPDFDKEEPDDGWEYIRRVKWEAAKCPGLKVAVISPEKLVNNQQTCYVPVVPEIPACEPHLLPSADWESKFLRTFTDLRSKFMRWEPPEPLLKPIPGLKDDCGWKSLCFGKPDDQFATAAGGVSVAEEMEEFGAGPLNFYRGELTTLLNLDEVNRAFLLRRQVAWIKGMDSLPRERALWLFALTAAVDEPVDADTSFALRSLLRSCAAIRAAGKFESDCELQLLNMIITVAGKYFGQDDSNRS